MAEDMLKKQAIEGMFAAVECIRERQRCRRTYGAAFDVYSVKGAPFLPNPWSVFRQCSLELHECEHSPKGI